LTRLTLGILHALDRHLYVSGLARKVSRLRDDNAMIGSGGGSRFGIRDQDLV